MMGTHGRTGLARVLMGSVAEYVLTRADCPVLAVKTPQSVSMFDRRTAIGLLANVHKLVQGRIRRSLKSTK